VAPVLSLLIEKLERHGQIERRKGGEGKKGKTKAHLKRGKGHLGGVGFGMEKSN